MLPSQPVKTFFTPVNKICCYNPDQVNVLIEWYIILMFILSFNDFTKITAIARKASLWRVYPNVKRKVTKSFIRRTHILRW